MAIRRFACCWFGVFVAVWLFRTWHWPFVGDGTLIRYVVLEMGRHSVPYRQIHDINMPGTYLLDWLVLKTLGSSAAAYRVYDYCLLAVVAAAMSYLAGARDRAWGFCGGCLFALFHARDGFAETGQRDLALAALLLAATAVVMHVRRSGNAKFMVLLGVLVGFACTIKPVGFLFPLVAAPLLLDRAARGHGVMARWMLVGLSIPLVSVLGFLYCYGAFGAFADTLLIEIPFHARLGARPFGVLMQELFTNSLMVWTCSVVVGWIWMRGKDFEKCVVCCGVAAGFLCYVLQMRGYNYHRYPFVAMVILALVLVLPRMLESASWMRVGGAMIALYCCALCPLFTRTALSMPRGMPPGLAQMEKDMRQVEGDGSYQCIDSTGGCIDTLVHLGRRQATGEMYDEFLFHRQMPGLLERRREEFLRDLMGRPPSVLVVTMGLFPDVAGGYDKLAEWPAFEQWMSSCYVVADDRFFAAMHGYPAIGYRVYRRGQAPCGSRPS